MPEGRPDRQNAVRAGLEQEGLDGVLVTGAANVRYLTGFTGSSAQLVVAPGRAVLITDFRYATQAPEEVGPDVEVRIERISLWEGLRQVVPALGARRVGVDRAKTSLADLDELRKLGGVEWVPIRGPAERLRASKGPREVASIVAAARLAEDALEAVLSFIAPGRSELDIAAELEAALRRRGSEWHPFPPIVASGPRSALPHARSTRRTVGRGELLLIDFGAQVDGYCSDITRTYVVGGPPDTRQREVYQVVRDAQARALSGLRAGLTGRAADALARDAIARAGMGEAFGHSLGHGLGLEVHEAPRLSRSSEAVLPVGAVVTVEPGVYFGGWGGVRIEDDVLLRPDGCDLLTSGATDLVQIT